MVANWDRARLGFPFPAKQGAFCSPHDEDFVRNPAPKSQLQLVTPVGDASLNPSLSMLVPPVCVALGPELFGKALRVGEPVVRVHQDGTLAADVNRLPGHANLV